MCGNQKTRIILYNIGRYVLGALFLVSGVAKGVNPFGLATQFDQYFAAMGIGALAPMSELFAIALPAVEILLALLLFSGLYARLTRWAVALMMFFFTGLTLWIAIENPVSDCGCFGQLVKISNWATLWKNVVFDLFVLMLFAIKPANKSSISLAILLCVVSLTLPVYCNFTLPIIENSPYAVGRSLPDGMSSDLVEQSTTLLEYRNKATGQTQLFAVDDSTWHDSAKWEYVATHTEVVSNGREAEISTLSMIDTTGRDRVQEIISDSGRTYLIIAPDPDMLSTAQMQRVIQTAAKADSENARAYMLRSTDSKFVPAKAEPLSVDRSTLSAMMANRYGGVMIIENGIVLTKKPL